MDRIRIFIYCSAAILCGWLTAAYTYQSGPVRAVEAQTSAGTATPPATESSKPTAQSGEENPQESLDTMATLKNQ